MEVLAAIDDTRFSSEVLDTAERMAALLSVRVKAVTALEEDHGGAASLASRAGVPLRLLFGEPATAILRALDDDAAVLAVLGSGRARSVADPVGHVTRGVVTSCAKDVVVVPRNPAPPPTGRPVKVVVPLDGDGATTKALARDLPALVDHGAEVIGLHVFGPGNAPRYWDHFPYDYLAWQEEFMRRSCPVPSGRLRVARGPVAAAVIDVAVREDAMLIAVAWSQDLSAGRARVVADLLLSSPVPLLLVPAGTRARSAGQLAASSA